MKKRLLSLLLLVAMIVTALPLVAFPITAAETEKEWTEEDYNAFFVKDGALFLSDFYTLNEYWGEEIEFPEAPTKQSAYVYYKDGKTYDFTKVENRLKTGTEWLVMRQKGDDDSTWGYLDINDSFGTVITKDNVYHNATEATALLKAYQMAGHPDATEVPAGETRFTAEDGYTYYIAKKYALSGSYFLSADAAFEYARSQYANAINAALANFLIAPASVEWNYYTPGIGNATHQDASGIFASKPFITVENGYVSFTPLHSNTYLGFKNLPELGEVYTEGVFSTPADKNTNSSSFFMVRDLQIGATVNANGIRFDRFNNYKNGTAQTNIPSINITADNGNGTASAYVAANTPFTLSMLTDRQYEGTYVVAKYKKDAKGNHTNGAAMKEDGSFISAYSATAGYPKLYATEAEALAAAKALAGEGATVLGNEFQSGEYYYTAERYNRFLQDVSYWVDGVQYADKFAMANDSIGYAIPKSVASYNTIFSFSVTGSYTRNMYSVRFYNRALSDAERAQNHFADIAKFFRIDLSPLALLDMKDMAGVFASVASFNFTSDKAAVEEAVRVAATAATQEKYASLKPAWVALAVQHGLDISPLLSQPLGLMGNTVKLLNTADPASTTLKADFEAAIAADLFSAPLTQDGYNALYVQDGLQIALDYFTSNALWGVEVAAANDAQYLWQWPAGYSKPLGKVTAPIADGALQIPSGTDVHLGNDTGKINGQAANGMTTEYVFTDSALTTGTILDIDDFRIYAGSVGKITAMGQRDYSRGVVRLPAAAEGGALGSLNSTIGTLANLTHSAGIPTTAVVQMKRPVMIRGWYSFNYTEADGYADVVKPTTEQMGGAAMFNTYFYVTHRLVDGALVAVENANLSNFNNPTLGTKHQYAYFMPVFFEKDGARYIVDAIDRTTNNGIGYGSLYATIDAEGNITLSDPDADFYNEELGSLAIRMDGETIFSREDLIFPNQSGLTGGSYLLYGYKVNRSAYAYRSYNRILTEAELAQNHFADLAKYFKLSLPGYDALVAAKDTEALAAVHAAVADYKIATADRVEVQNVVSAVLNSYVDATYEAMKTGDATVDAFIDLACAYRLDIADVLAAKRDMSSVYALSFDGLTCAEAQLLLDEAYLDAYYYLAYTVADTADRAAEWNAMLKDLANGTARVELEALMALPYAERLGAIDAIADAADVQAAVDAYVATAMEKYATGNKDFNYNALYVQDGLLLAADFFKYNSYWGAELDAPIAPADNKAYWYDTNKDGEKTEDEIFDLTDPAVAYAPTWAVFKVASNGWSYSDTGLNGYATREEAIAVACEMAGHPAGTAYPEVSSNNKTGGYVDPEGNTYFVDHSDASDVFKAASLEWRNVLEPAFMNGVTWHAENGMNLFSYTKLSNSVAVQRVRGVALDHAPYVLGEGFFTISNNHDSDGGLQTNIKINTNAALANDEMTMQMVASINPDAKNISSSVLFLNARPGITRSGDKLFFGTMDASSLFKVERNNLPAPVEVPTGDVADMTYVLSGIMTPNGDSKDCDTLKISTEKGELISFNGYYNSASINSTSYIGYHMNLDGSKVYAIRYYNVALTQDEILQNHFADLAKYFRLDLTTYGKFTAEMKAELLAAFADDTFESATKAGLQAEYNKVAAALLDGTVIFEDEAENARFLELAAAAALDLAPIVNLKADLREAIAAELLAAFNMDYSVNADVVAYYYAEATYTFSALTFAGYQVRLTTGSALADYAGVRAVFNVDAARIAEIAKEKGEPVVLTANVLTGDATVKATLTFTFTWNAAEEKLEYVGTNATAAGTTEAILYSRTDDMGNEIISFNYTVTFKGEDRTADKMNAEFSYSYAITVGDGETADFGVVSQAFGSAISAVEAYTYFANHGFDTDSVVSGVVAEFPTEE